MEWSGGDDDNNDNNKGMTSGMAMFGLTGARREGVIQTTINQSERGGKNWGNDRVKGGAYNKTMTTRPRHITIN